jgi:hypothetical protein
VGGVHEGFGIKFELLDCDLLPLTMILHGTAMKYNLNAAIEPPRSSLQTASLCRQPPILQITRF